MVKQKVKVLLCWWTAFLPSQ